MVFPFLCTLEFPSLGKVSQVYLLFIHLLSQPKISPSICLQFFVSPEKSIAGAQRSRYPLGSLVGCDFPSLNSNSLQPHRSAITTGFQVSIFFLIAKLVSTWSNHTVCSISRHVVPQLSVRCYLPTILYVSLWRVTLYMLVPIHANLPVRWFPSTFDFFSDPWLRFATTQ